MLNSISSKKNVHFAMSLIEVAVFLKVKDHQESI